MELARLGCASVRGRATSGRAAALEKALAALGAPVKRDADPAQVKQLSDDASTALNAVLGRGS